MSDTEPHGHRLGRAWIAERVRERAEAKQADEPAAPPKDEPEGTSHGRPATRGELKRILDERWEFLEPGMRFLKDHGD